MNSYRWLILQENFLNWLYAKFVGWYVRRRRTINRKLLTRNYEVSDEQ